MLAMAQVYWALGSAGLILAEKRGIAEALDRFQPAKANGRSSPSGLSVREMTMSSRGGDSNRHPSPGRYALSLPPLSVERGGDPLGGCASPLWGSRNRCRLRRLDEYPFETEWHLGASPPPRYARPMREVPGLTSTSRSWEAAGWFGRRALVCGRACASLFSSASSFPGTGPGRRCRLASSRSSPSLGSPRLSPPPGSLVTREHG